MQWPGSVVKSECPWSELLQTSGRHSDAAAHIVHSCQKQLMCFFVQASLFSSLDTQIVHCMSRSLSCVLFCPIITFASFSLLGGDERTGGPSCPWLYWTYWDYRIFLPGQGSSSLSLEHAICIDTFCSKINLENCWHWHKKFWQFQRRCQPSMWFVMMMARRHNVFRLLRRQDVAGWAKGYILAFTTPIYINQLAGEEIELWSSLPTKAEQL